MSMTAPTTAAGVAPTWHEAARTAAGMPLACCPTAAANAAASGGICLTDNARAGASAPHASSHYAWSLALGRIGVKSDSLARSSLQNVLRLVPTCIGGSTIFVQAGGARCPAHKRARGAAKFAAMRLRRSGVGDDHHSCARMLPAPCAFRTFASL